jgi:hypothetical protein
MDEGRDYLNVKKAQRTAERKARQEERSRLRDGKTVTTAQNGGLDYRDTQYCAQWTNVGILIRP